MNNKFPSQIISFFRFMRLFEISLFSVLRTDPNHIYAIVAWEDDCYEGIPDAEEVQEVCWEYNKDCHLDDALLIGECAYDAGWIVSDQISLNKRELQKTLDWDIRRLEKALWKLMQIKVYMIDDGEKTDSFFFHERKGEIKVAQKKGDRPR